jgi:urease accessory protein
MDQDDESYILLLLSDSNLPTGSFVASAGLESYITHGFFEKWRSSVDYTATINFLRDSIGSYARAALPFVTDAHDIMSEALLELGRSQDLHVAKDKAIEALSALDNLYERMSLNHVTRRASRAQGVALLTLYSRGFARPVLSQSSTDDSVECPSEDARAKHAAEIIDALKLLVRREQIPGHLPICWGILTAALNLSNRV